MRLYQRWRSAVQVEWTLKENEKMEGKKIPKVTVMAVVVDSVYGICAQVMVQRASDFGVFFPSSAP